MSFRIMQNKKRYTNIKLDYFFSLQSHREPQPRDEIAALQLQFIDESFQCDTCAFICKELQALSEHLRRR